MPREVTEVTEEKETSLINAEGWLIRNGAQIHRDEMINLAKELSSLHENDIALQPWGQILEHFEKKGWSVRKMHDSDDGSLAVVWARTAFPFDVIFMSLYTGYDAEEITVFPNVGWAVEE